MRKTLIGLTLFTAIGTIVYWITVFTGLFPVTDLVPGYVTWFMSFPLADAWLAITGLIAGILLIKNKELSVPFGIACGSSMIFLGLYGLLYGINTGLIFILTVDEIIEIIIKVYCLSVGSLFITKFWQIRTTLT